MLRSTTSGMGSLRVQALMGVSLFLRSYVIGAAHSHMQGSPSETANKISAKLVARVDNAHGSAEINCIAWAPVDDSSEHGASLLGTAGDDGHVHIWQWQGQVAE